MITILIKTGKTTERLLFVLEWLFAERLKTDYTIITNADAAKNMPHIVYGGNSENSISIPDAGLLWQTQIHPTDLQSGSFHGVPTIFNNQQADYSIPFDLFSALFYLLSRYEEYLPHTKDKHGRYPATESILYKLGCLHQPVADIWVAAFKKLLEAKYNMRFPAQHYQYIPTYDIDIAWSYKNKGWKRTAGALAQGFSRGAFSEISERLAVLSGKRQDPYDSFSFLEACHQYPGIRPVYFILSSQQTTAFDKNIPPGNPAMQLLIKKIARRGIIGIHPSYYSQEGDTMRREKLLLEEIMGEEIQISRQHYLHMQLPETYRILIKAGIKEDYTMGYGTHLGFRAGTSHPFSWYDLQQEQITGLKIYPFCFMDTTCHYNLHLSAGEAFTQLEAMSDILKELDGLLITIFHNFSLGTDSQWDKWQAYYESFIKKQAERLASQ